MKAWADHRSSSSPYKYSFIFSFDNFDNMGIIILMDDLVLRVWYKQKRLKKISFSLISTDYRFYSISEVRSG